MNRSYTLEERKKAVAEYRRTKSVVETIRNLGYPGRWTMYKWLREPLKPGPKPRKQAKKLRSYPWKLKLEAVQMYKEGLRPQEIADKLDLYTKMSVYSWAQAYRELGEWGLMSNEERRTERKIPTKKSLKASLPDDPKELKKLAAQLMVEKAVMAEELMLIKKDDSVTPGALNNLQKTLVVDALRNHLPLPMLLETAGLSTSTFYYQLAAQARLDPLQDVRLRIAEIAEESHFTYGYRRTWWVLRHEGITISEKVVRRLMQEMAIPVRSPRRKIRYSSYAGEITPAPPNIVKRNFHADEPSMLWLTDITEFVASNGKVYLSAIVDCFDGKIVGWKTGRHPTMEIAEKSLIEALESHPPTALNKLVVHSDRGTHYRANSWITITRTAGIIRSMSKKGCSPDNSACEGFFGRMKNEMYYHKIWHRVDELEEAVNSYIEFYNKVRIKDSLGGISIHAHRNLIAS